jgi:hypothetical protein
VLRRSRRHPYLEILEVAPSYREGVQAEWRHITRLGGGRFLLNGPTSHPRGGKVTSRFNAQRHPRIGRRFYYSAGCIYDMPALRDTEPPSTTAQIIRRLEDEHGCAYVDGSSRHGPCRKLFPGERLKWCAICLAVGALRRVTKRTPRSGRSPLTRMPAVTSSCRARRLDSLRLRMALRGCNIRASGRIAGPVVGDSAL